MNAQRHSTARVEPVVHVCVQKWKLGAIIAIGIVGGGWLFNTVYAGELERREMRTKLERMAEDISAIRVALEDAMKKGKP